MVYLQFRVVLMTCAEQRTPRSVQLLLCTRAVLARVPGPALVTRARPGHQVAGATVLTAALLQTVLAVVTFWTFVLALKNTNCYKKP